MSAMCVSTLTISHITSRKKRTQRRSSWAECLGRIGEISPHHTSHIIAPHQTSDITSHHITHHKPKEEHTEKKFLGRVLGPDRRNLTTSHITHHCISPDIRHHISPHHTSQAERREHKEEVLGPSSWAGWHSHHITHHHISPHQTSQAERHNLTTSHITHHCISPDIRHHISPYHTSQAERREHKEEVLGPSSWAGWHSHHITHHHISPNQTSQAERAKKYEFYCENVVQEHPRRTKSTRITTKNEHRRNRRAEKARELPRETRFRPFQEHRRHTKSTIITMKNEHRKS